MKFKLYCIVLWLNSVQCMTRVGLGSKFKLITYIQQTIANLTVG